MVSTRLRHPRRSRLPVSTFDRVDRLDGLPVSGHYRGAQTHNSPRGVVAHPPGARMWPRSASGARWGHVVAPEQGGVSGLRVRFWRHLGVSQVVPSLTVVGRPHGVYT